MQNLGQLCSLILIYLCVCYHCIILDLKEESQGQSELGYYDSFTYTEMGTGLDPSPGGFPLD